MSRSSGAAIRVVTMVNTTLMATQRAAPLNRYLCRSSLSLAPKLSATGMPKPLQVASMKPMIMKLRE